MKSLTKFCFDHMECCDVSIPQMDAFEFLRQQRDHQSMGCAGAGMTEFGRPEDMERAKNCRVLFAHYETRRISRSCLQHFKPCPTQAAKNIEIAS